MAISTNVPSDKFEDLQRDVQDATRFVNAIEPFQNRTGKTIKPLPVLVEEIAQDLAGSQKVIAVPHLKALATMPLIHGQQYSVVSFYDGWAVSAQNPIGGGIFVYDSTRNKSESNGEKVIAPEALVAWDGTQQNLETLINWSGTGVGCFVKTQHMTDFMPQGQYDYLWEDGLNDVSNNLIKYSKFTGQDFYGYKFSGRQNLSPVKSSYNKASTASQRVMTFKFPLDTARNLSKAVLDLSFNFTQPFTGSAEICLSDVRTSQQHRYATTVSGTNVAFKLAVSLFNDTTGVFRVDDLLGNFTGINPYIVRSGNGLSGFAITVFLKTDAAFAGNVDFNGQCDVVLKSVQEINRNKRNQFFDKDDVFNKPITTFAKTYSLITSAQASGSAPHYSITAGSDLITVVSTTGIQIGDLVACATVSTGPYEEFNFFRNYISFIIKEKDTIAQLGAECYVTEIVNATTIRVSKPALQTLAPTGRDFARRADGLAIGDPRTIDIKSKTNANNAISPVLSTGVSGTSNRATPWLGEVSLYYTKESDPIRRFKFTQLLTQNNWVFKILQGTTNNFGEEYREGVFELHCPENIVGLVSNRNADRNLVLITPCGKYAVEMFFVTTLTNDPQGAVFRAARVAVIDILSKSYIKSDPNKTYLETMSTRAHGGSLLAGLVTKEDLESLGEPDTFGEYDLRSNILKALNHIKHALVIVAPSSVLMAGKNSAGNLFSLPNVFTNLTITSGGSNYHVGDMFRIEGAGVTKIVGRVTSINLSSPYANGSVTGVELLSCGQYTTGSLVGNTRSLTGDGTGLTFQSITLSNTQRSSLFIQPAVNADNGYATSYAGSIPMGQMFTIDPRIDLENEFYLKLAYRLGIRNFREFDIRESYEYIAILGAIKNYGLYLVDVASNTTLSVTIQANMPEVLKARIHGDTGGFTLPNMGSLIDLLVACDDFK